MQGFANDLGTPEIKVNKKNDLMANIVVSPLPRGYGQTLGNALRRTLLSSIPGAAVTAIKIKGVTHEYMTVDGVKDSVLEMIFNIKNIRIIKHIEEPVILKLAIKGKAGEVTAASVESNSNVEIVNPDQVITTLDNKKSELEMELLVESGVGYSPATERSGLETHMIAIDAIFSPVRNVRLEVTPTRVGQHTDLDKLDVEVETDGTFDPNEALKFASNILKFYYGLFDKASNEYIDQLVGETQIVKEEVVEEKKEETYTPVEVLSLSPRTLNALINGGIDSIEKLEKTTKKQLNELKGFGKKAMDEITEAMRAIGKDIIGAS